VGKEITTNVKPLKYIANEVKESKHHRPLPSPATQGHREFNKPIIIYLQISVSVYTYT